VTLKQLQSFATVARLGSVRRAAAELGVSEAAVSLAVGALRREIGDDLYVRNGRGITLTAGGRRFATIATEILGLAHNARRAVNETRGERFLMYVVATSDVAEHAAAPLLDAFSGTVPDVDVAVEEKPAEEFAELLEQRRADIALGPAPSTRPEILSVPFLRYRMLVVAAPGHALSRARSVAWPRLSGERWLVGPGDIGPTTPTGELFHRHGIAPDDVRAYPNYAAAVAAAEAGEGVMLALAHTIQDALRRPSLVPVAVRGTPLSGRWFASTLSAARSLPAAGALQRFVKTREASRAIFTPSSGVPAGRFRPPVHVTLWSSVAADVDSANERAVRETARLGRGSG
jgi:DNA-binding transcriptional LysR family regulator